MGQSRPLFCFMVVLWTHNSNINWKSVDGGFGIRTCGCRMVGADRSTKLWWLSQLFQILALTFLLIKIFFGYQFLRSNHINQRTKNDLQQIWLNFSAFLSFYLHGCLSVCRSVCNTIKKPQKINHKRNLRLYYNCPKSFKTPVGEWLLSTWSQPALGVKCFELYLMDR